MGNFANNALTNSGMALLADVHSGAVLIPTKIVIGSGEMPANKTPATMTDVVAPVKNLSVTKKKRSADGKCIFGGVYNNEDVTAAFYFRELALYCRAEYRDEAGNVTQSVPECLYCYGNSGDTADYMPAYSTGAVVEKQIDLVVWVGNEAEVDLSVASGIYALKEDFDAHVDDSSLHAYAALASSTDGVAYTTTIEDITNLHDGMLVIMVPSRDSAAQTPTLNINDLGAKEIRRPGSANSSAAYGGIEPNWLRANYAVLLLYSGGNWICQSMTKVRGDDLYGHVPVASGGTGATTADAARKNLGALYNGGDTMLGQLLFDTPGLFTAIAKKRTVEGVNYMMRAGVGNYGTGATVSLRLATVAADGTETITGQFDLDNTGVYWTPNGGTRRTIAHSGNLGVLTASVG